MKEITWIESTLQYNNEWSGWDVKRKPNNDDPPKQEMNQYWTIKYGNQKLYIHKGQIKKWSDLLKESEQKLAQMPEHVEMKTNNGSLF